jgi:serine protease Do
MQKLGSKRGWGIPWGAFFGALFGAGIAIFLSNQGFLSKPVIIERPAYQNEAQRVYATASGEENITYSRQNAIVKAAQKVGPTVVSISVVQVRLVRESPFFSPFGDDFSDQFWEGFFRPREYKEKVYSIGSGVIINPEGYVLTNAHVVGGADQLKVTLTTGEEYPGKVVGQDQASDLAVVKIDAKSLPYSSLGNSDDLIIGEWAIAVGNPFGYLLDDPNPTVTVGVISAVNRDIKREKGQVQIYRKMIQTDAAINPGNSGGPLVNADGEVIGINTFIFTTSRGSEGIGFAIPINRAKAILSDLIKHGEVERTWIGVKVQDLTLPLAQGLELGNTQGVIVSDVEEESPAEKAGIKRKDVIIKANDQKIGNSNDWEDFTYLARSGEPVDISLLRNGKQVHAKLIPEAPPTRIAKGSPNTLGMTVSNITLAIANQLGIYDRKGVVIIGVERGSPAYNSGLEVGDIIRQIGDKPIQDVEAYDDVMKKIKDKGKPIMLIEREGSLYYVTFGR